MSALLLPLLQLQQLHAGAAFFCSLKVRALFFVSPLLLLHTFCAPHSSTHGRRRVEQVLKRYERGEVEHVPWLDRLAMHSVEQLRQQEQQRQRQEEAAAAELGGDAGTLQLLVELPSFPRAVIYQQAAVGHPAGAAAATGASTADAISTPLPGTSGAGTGGVAGLSSAAAAASASTAGSPLMLLHDAEVGRDIPAEAKAAKLARSLTRGMVDKRLKPDTEERRRIEAVLDYPPNR